MQAAIPTLPSSPDTDKAERLAELATLIGQRHAGAERAMLEPLRRLLSAGRPRRRGPAHDRGPVRHGEFAPEVWRTRTAGQPKLARC